MQWYTNRLVDVLENNWEYVGRLTAKVNEWENGVSS